MKIISQGKTLRDRLIMSIFYDSGLRVEELVELKAVNNVKIHKGQGLHHWSDRRKYHPKGQEFFLSQDTLSKFIKYIDEEKPAEKSKWMFPSPTDPTKHLSSKRVFGIVKQAGAAAGTPFIFPHYFRHALATHMYVRGADLKDIA